MCRNQFFFILANNSNSKQNNKNPTHAFVDIGKLGTCAMFQQSLLKPVVVGARQRQITWFTVNNRALSKLLYGILHYLIIITKLSIHISP